MTSISKIQENAYATAALFEAGVAMMRQNLRRRHAAAMDAEIETMLIAWLRRSDDPIQGDVSGNVSMRVPSR